MLLDAQVVKIQSVLSLLCCTNQVVIEVQGCLLFFIPGSDNLIPNLKFCDKFFFLAITGLLMEECSICITFFQVQNARLEPGNSAL